jgi:cytochrome c
MAKRRTVEKPLVSLKLLYTVLVLAAILVAAVLTRAYIRSVSPEVTVTQNQQISEVKSFVDLAAKLVEEEGTDAFQQFKKEGEWYTGNKYIFVYDINGNTVVLPPQPELEGVNRLDAVDSNGVYFVKDMINQAYNKDSGWVNYLYPKPGETTPVEKLGYFKKVLVQGKYYIVGSGTYLE